MSEDQSISIFVVDSVGEHRGMHYFNFPLATRLRKSGLEVTLLSTPETISHPLFPKNINSQSVFKGIYGGQPKILRGMNYALSLLKIYWLCIRNQPNIVHFHFFQLPILDLLLLYLLNLTDSLTVTSVHDVVPLSINGGFSSIGARIYRLIYKVSTGLVVLSQYSKNILLELDPDLSEKFVVIPHPNYSYFTDLDNQNTQAQTEEVKLQIGLNPEDKVLLVFGTIKQNKRLDWVIRAMGLIYDSYPQAKLVIVGKPQDRDVVSDMKLVEELGLSGRVYWRTERASDEELWQYFSSAEITLFPYEYIYQSGAIIMAFNFAKPVIATSVGSNIELIQDGKTGLLVAPDDPVGFANAITEILDDYKKAADLGQGGLRFVTDELSWEMIADRYLNYYRELVLVGSN